MDQIFERLGRLIRSWGRPSSEEPHQGMDPDTWAAYQELEEELSKAKKTRPSPATGSTYRPASAQLPADVQVAYRVLGLEPGLDLEAVRKAHKFLILKNHPDRFASDPKKYRDATEVTQKINQAYQRIKEFYRKI